MIDRWEMLYGNESGRWLLLSGMHTEIPPPKVADLMFLGPVNDLIRWTVMRMTEEGRKRKRRVQAQHDMAELLGVAQQTVSLAVRNRRVNVPDEGLSGLVAKYFELVVTASWPSWAAEPSGCKPFTADGDAVH